MSNCRRGTAQVRGAGAFGPRPSLQVERVGQRWLAVAAFLGHQAHRLDRAEATNSSAFFPEHKGLACPRDLLSNPIMLIVYQ